MLIFFCFFHKSVIYCFTPLLRNTIMNLCFLLKIKFHVTVNLKISLYKVLTDVIWSFISKKNCSFIHNWKQSKENLKRQITTVQILQNFSLFNSQHQNYEVNCFWILLYQMSATLLITEQATFELNSSASHWGMWLLIEHRCNGWYTVTQSDINLRSLLK